MRTCELNFAGLVDPPRGQLMGPDMKGRIYKVVRAVFDTKEQKTTVTIEEVERVS